eukprot:450658_1
MEQKQATNSVPEAKSQHQPSPSPAPPSNNNNTNKKEKEKEGTRTNTNDAISTQLSSNTAGKRRIGRWFIQETLGKGGYSWVKKGVDKKNGRIVALKFMERRLGKKK